MIKKGNLDSKILASCPIIRIMNGKTVSITPKSDNFKGTAKNWKDYDENGKKKKKATQLAEKGKLFSGPMKAVQEKKATQSE